MENVDENDKPLVEELVLYMKSFVSDIENKERFLNIELLQDDNRYILLAQVQGNELSGDELSSIKAISRNNVSAIFNDSKVYVRTFVLRGSSKGKAVNPQVLDLKLILQMHYCQQQKTSSFLA